MTDDASASLPVMSAVGVRREMRRRRLDAWTVWVGYRLGGTATFPELSAALAGTAAFSPQQTYLLVQALNF